MNSEEDSPGTVTPQDRESGPNGMLDPIPSSGSPAHVDASGNHEDAKGRLRHPVLPSLGDVITVASLIVGVVLSIQAGQWIIIPLLPFAVYLARIFLILLERGAITNDLWLGLALTGIFLCAFPLAAAISANTGSEVGSRLAFVQDRSIMSWDRRGESRVLFEARDDVDDVAIDSLVWNPKGDKIAARVTYGTYPQSRSEIVTVNLASSEVRTWDCECDSVGWVDDSVWAVAGSSLLTFTLGSSGPRETPLSLDESSVTAEMADLGLELPLQNPSIIASDSGSVIVESTTEGSGYVSEPVFSVVDRLGVVYPFRALSIDDAVNSGLDREYWDPASDTITINVGWRNGECQETQSVHRLSADGSTDRLPPPGDEGWTVSDLTTFDGRLVVAWRQETLVELGRCEIVEPDLYEWDGQRWRRMDLPRGSWRVRFAPDGSVAVEARAGVDGIPVLQVVDGDGGNAVAVAESPGVFAWSD